MHTIAETLYMQRAIELAKLGTGKVSPNPLVGALIVYNNKIISEAWHEKFGSAHAERVAIENVLYKYDNGQEILKKSVLYVTLEPCNHYGKTPPCTDIIIQYQIPKVIIGQIDSNPIVKGKGINTLKKANIEVKQGVLEEDCKSINKYYNTFHQRRRPYIIIKWAQSIDGYFAPKEGIRYPLTDNYTAIIQHKFRSTLDGILVGYNTAKIDNPLLNTRHWIKNPIIRFVIDKKLSLPNDLVIFNDDSKTIVFNSIKNLISNNVKYIKIDCSAQAICYEIANSLYDLNVQAIMVEGGAKTINLFKDSHLWDEAHVYTAPIKIIAGLKAPERPAEELLRSRHNFITDSLDIYKNS